MRQIAILRGGSASEREISLRSGGAVLAACQQAGWPVEDWVVNDIADVIPLLASKSEKPFIFNTVHGRGGEDGQLQALLDVLQVGYSGSGMLASAISMDKILTKRLWREMGLPTADFWVVTTESLADLSPEELPYPLMVKPACEGSSIGMRKVESADQLMAAVNHALSYDNQVLLERWIVGKEYTVAILGDQALPMIRLQTPNGFYDFDAKYVANTTQYVCPCGLDASTEKSVSALAVQAFDALGAKVWGRIDLMIDDTGKVWLLELNTVPGMTDHSLVPMAAQAAGMSFVQLIERVIELSACAG